MSSYQRLKRKNEELRRQLVQVCLAPDSEEGQAIIKVIKTEHQLEAALWAGGEHLKNTDASKFEGYIKWVESWPKISK